MDGFDKDNDRWGEGRKKAAELREIWGVSIQFAKQTRTTIPSCNYGEL